MRALTVAPKDAGKRLDRWVRALAPSLPAGLAQKFFRLGRIKLNGKAAKPDARCAAGDVVSLFFEDEYFAERPRENKLLSHFKPRVEIVYEDEHILLADKRPGLCAHPDEGEKVDTLITHLQAYLYQKGEWDGAGFAPALCNRIDRFTGGIVICAKTREALDVMNRKIRAREVSKFYLCAIAGRMRPASGALKGYLLKEGKRVRALQADAPGAQYAETRYATLATDGETSLLECALVTGRTHQIRAQFAAAGHPLLGDTQYGDPAINSRYPAHYQQLLAYRVRFDFAGDAGCLNALAGREFQLSKLHPGFSEIARLLARME